MAVPLASSSDCWLLGFSGFHPESMLLLLCCTLFGLVSSWPPPWWPWGDSLISVTWIWNPNASIFSPFWEKKTWGIVETFHLSHVTQHSHFSVFQALTSVFEQKAECWGQISLPHVNRSKLKCQCWYNKSSIYSFKWEKRLLTIFSCIRWTTPLSSSTGVFFSRSPQEGGWWELLRN